MHFLFDFFKGVVIGAGAILPGLSSGVLCVVFGIYETLLNCALNFFKNFKYNFRILFPIALGAFVGIIIFGNILKYIFYAYPLQTQSIFIGLIIGSIPELLKKASTSIINSKKKTSTKYKDIKTSYCFKFKNYIYIFISCCVGILLVYIENKYKFSNNSTHFSFLYLVFSGFVMSTGVIIPGVSSTLLLMLLGVYDAYLLSVSSLYIPFLFPLALGLFIGSVCCMKLIKLLFDKYYTQTFFCIIGFTIGSIFVLFPNIYSLNDLILSFLCILLGLFLVYFT